jgi:IclR family KDG regulon transcriptional repressor
MDMLQVRSREIRVPAVDRAFDLLDLLGRSGTGLTLTEMSRMLRIPKSTVFCLISTLAYRGCIQRVPGSRQYSIGPRAFEFASGDVGERELRRISTPHMRRLAGKLRMTVQTAVLRAGEGVIIDKADSPRDLWGGSWVGRHFDLHCTGQGKALIAWMSHDELARMFARRGFIAYTPFTIRSLDALEKDLAQTRMRGFALNLEEHCLGIRGIGAPIVNHFGNVVASVSVRGVLREIPDGRITEIGSTVVAIGHEVSRELLDGSLTGS